MKRMGGLLGMLAILCAIALAACSGDDESEQARDSAARPAVIAQAPASRIPLASGPPPVGRPRLLSMFSDPVRAEPEPPAQPSKADDGGAPPTQRER